MINPKGFNGNSGLKSQRQKLYKPFKNSLDYRSEKTCRMISNTKSWQKVRKLKKNYKWPTPIVTLAKDNYYMPIPCSGVEPVTQAFKFWWHANPVPHWHPMLTRSAKFRSNYNTRIYSVINWTTHPGLLAISVLVWCPCMGVEPRSDNNFPS